MEFINKYFPEIFSFFCTCYCGDTYYPFCNFFKPLWYWSLEQGELWGVARGRRRAREKQTHREERRWGCKGPELQTIKNTIKVHTDKEKLYLTQSKHCSLVLQAQKCHNWNEINHFLIWLQQAEAEVEYVYLKIITTIITNGFYI